jgi:hypothetical protein
MTTDARIELVDFRRVAPGVRAALSAISKAVDDSDLGKELTELIKIRASQTNGFWLQFHLNAAQRETLADEDGSGCSVA